MYCARDLKYRKARKWQHTANALRLGNALNEIRVDSSEHESQSNDYGGNQRAGFCCRIGFNLLACFATAKDAHDSIRGFWRPFLHRNDGIPSQRACLRC